MKNTLFRLLFLTLLLALAGGCAAFEEEKLPAEDIEVLTKHKKIIDILKNPAYSTRSREKYEAARELIRKVDLHFVRETGTVDNLFYYRDAIIDDPGSIRPVFTFDYRWENHYVRIRFFTHRIWVTRVEITEE